ncbi:MAG: hypothetical protein QGG39_12075 [Candidatus Poribacteria bacterium]|nr:hypothetical protein [Candidatus Poribacteria bacterium]
MTVSQVRNVLRNKRYVSGYRFVPEEESENTFPVPEKWGWY